MQHSRRFTGSALPSIAEQDEPELTAAGLELPQSIERAQQQVDAAYALNDAVGTERQQMAAAAAAALAAVAQAETRGRAVAPELEQMAAPSTSAVPFSSSALRSRLLRRVDGCPPPCDWLLGRHAGRLAPEVRARLCALRGKALASTPDGQSDSKASDLLAAAVKLDPSLGDTWRVLAECLCARGDSRLAVLTLRHALEFERAPETLTLLAMLLRRVARADGEGAVLLLESHRLAKEAVGLAPTVAAHWAGLGSASLSLYLGVNQGLDDLRLAAAAYAQAEARADAAGEPRNPDTEHNHANTLHLLRSQVGTAGTEQLARRRAAAER